MIRKSLMFPIMILMLISFVIGCTPKSPEIVVSAASSITEALNEAKTAYEKNSKVKIIFNFASSGTLQKQIQQGAPADLFISAGTQQMDTLEKNNLIVNDSRVNLLANSLVLIAQSNNDYLKNFKDLTDKRINKIAIGIPETVPAGKYAKETLASFKLWEPLKPKLVFAKDVRQVLAYVESGNAEAGIVYKSDLTNTKKVTIIEIAPRKSHAEIFYPSAIVQASQAKEEALKFLEYLQSKEAQLIFTKYGFTPVH